MNTEASLQNTAPGANSEWERSIEYLWSTFSVRDCQDFLSRMTDLTQQRQGLPEAAFELASAYDSCGFEVVAEKLYRSALGNGLTGYRKTRANIQLASTLRNLGQVDESVAILEAELQRGDAGELATAVAAFLALSFAAQDRHREALGLALEALASHLPRYNASLTRYAKGLR